MAALAGCLAVGCSKSTYFQVYQTQPVNTEKCVAKDGKLVHESGDFTVRYNFFAENGDAGFWFINNSDSVVFLNLAESFFILNGHANDYYQARGWTTTKSSTITISKQERKNKKKSSSENTEGSSTSEMKASQVTERAIVAIPPHSTKYISEYHIVSKELEMCGVKLSPTVVSRVRKEALTRSAFIERYIPAAPPVPERRRQCGIPCQKSPRPDSRRLPATRAPLSA